MICPNCGRETPDGMSFCFNCGARIAAQSQVQQAQQQAQAAQQQAQEQARLAAEKAQREAAEAQARAQREAAERAQREAAERAQREAAERAQREAAERAQREAAEKAQREAAEAQARAQQEAQQVQQQAQQAAQNPYPYAQQFNQQPQQAYGPQGPQQYGPQPYGPQGPQQYGPQAPQQYAPKAPKEPSAFDKLLTGEPAWLLNFYTKNYNFFLIICSLITIAFVGCAFAMRGMTGWTLTNLFLAGATAGAAIFAQIMLANKKFIGVIMTFVAGGLRFITVLLVMIAIFAMKRVYGYTVTSVILFNCFYSIVALMVQGALAAFAVILFLKNKDKFK